MRRSHSGPPLFPEAVLLPDPVAAFAYITPFMTEIQLNLSTFVNTLEAIRSKFTLASTTVTLETDESGKQFILTARRENAPEVRAFGPCEVKGAPLNVEFDMADLESAIANASVSGETLTLLVGDGLWVKETAPAADEEE